MGVPRFARYLVQRYDGIQRTVTPSNFINIKNGVDWICFDLNGDIHPVSEEVYRYGNRRMLTGKDPPPYVEGEWQPFFDAVSSRIERVTNWLKPQVGIYIALDGSAPRAKQMQQRIRRFRSVTSDNIPENVFDSRALSAGSKLIFQLDRWLKWWIRLKIEDTGWRNLTVHFSSSRVAGEGEHKINEWMRINKKVLANHQIMMMGMDADLFMLLLSQHTNNLWLLRDESHDDVITPFEERNHLLISVAKLRDRIKKDLWAKRDLKYMNEERVIDDFILLTFFVGNDFLPHSPLFEYLVNGMNWMLESYVEYLTTHRNSIQIGLTVGTKINWTQFYQYLEVLSKREQEFAVKTAGNQHNKFKNETLLECCEEKGTRVDLKQYKSAWYSKFEEEMAGDFRLHAAKEYARGLAWVYQYYSSGVPDWQWAYPYHYAPFLSDLLKSRFTPAQFIKNSPTPPVLQLMCVLPKCSIRLLPPEHQKRCAKLRYTDPMSIKVDYEGVWAEYQGVYLLPPADVRKFKRIHDSVEPNIIDKPDVETIMWYSEEEDYKFRTPFGTRRFSIVATDMKQYMGRKPPYMLPSVFKPKPKPISADFFSKPSSSSHSRSNSQISDFGHSHPRLNSQISDFSHNHPHSNSQVSKSDHSHSNSQISESDHSHSNSQVSESDHSHSNSQVSESSHSHPRLNSQVSSESISKVKTFELKPKITEFVGEGKHIVVRPNNNPVPVKANNKDGTASSFLLPKPPPVVMEFSLATKAKTFGVTKNISVRPMSHGYSPVTVPSSRGLVYASRPVPTENYRKTEY